MCASGGTCTKGSALGLGTMGSTYVYNMDKEGATPGGSMPDMGLAPVGIG